jgi:single-strand DNA-binding protein
MATRSLNKVMLIGNLTRDPNMRFTPGGAAVCSFGLATNRSWVNNDTGDKQEKVDFHNIVAWSKLAEICGQLLHKGDKVYVEGRLQTRDWKGNDGTDRRITEIVIDNMMLLHSSSGSSSSYSDGSGDFQSGGYQDPTDDAATPAPKTSKKAAQNDDVAAPTDDVIDDVEDIADDIPF